MRTICKVRTKIWVLTLLRPQYACLEHTDAKKPGNRWVLTYTVLLNLCVSPPYTLYTIPLGRLTIPLEFRRRCVREVLIIPYRLKICVIRSPHYNFKCQKMCVLESPHYNFNFQKVCVSKGPHFAFKFTCLECVLILT